MNNSTISAIALEPIALQSSPNTQWTPLSKIPTLVSKIPTLGSARYYHRSFWNFWHPIVVPIAGRNWEVVYDASYTCQGLPNPQASTVSFTLTQASETPYTPAKNRVRLTEDDFAIPVGRLYPIRFFKCLPIHDEGVHIPKGLQLYHLAVFWTGWGDGGNENLFVSLNEKGVPSAVYVEYSAGYAED